MNPIISVIVPIYGVENFVERCVRSLFLQDLNEEVEFIFVDDASPDKSIERLKKVIEEFPNRIPQIHVVCHEENQGLPDARNTGLGLARGEYILHIDSDDYVEPTMLSAMLEVARKEDADIVWCDWYLDLGHRERCMYEPKVSVPHDAVCEMLSGGMKFNVWNKLVSRRLYIENDIKFPSGYGMGEDMTMILLYAHANKVVHLSKALYHYVKGNAEAFSRTYSDAHLAQLKYNVNRISRYLTKHFDKEYDFVLPFLQLEVKFPFLLMPDNKYLQSWMKWYPEANRWILKNRHIPLRSRIVQWCAYHKLWFFVKMYRNLLNRIVYGNK